jgi:uncharacterized protein YbcI
MPEAPRSFLQEISDEVARIYKARYGRGPASITTHVLGDAVICLLEDVNTTAQTALVEGGRVELAQSVHGELQRAMADAMSAAVERATGRTVRGYVPGYNVAINATTDVFLLEPVAA